MQSVGDMARALVLRTNQVRLREEMDKLAVEVSTGFVTDSAKHLNGDLTSLQEIDPAGWQIQSPPACIPDHWKEGYQVKVSLLLHNLFPCAVSILPPTRLQLFWEQQVLQGHELFPDYYDPVFRKCCSILFQLS